MQQTSLLSLLSMRKISLALSFLLLAGCAHKSPSLDEPGDTGLHNQPFIQSDFDELLAFGANMAKMSPSSRGEMCRTLLKRQKNSPGAGVFIHLMVGRLLSDECGDISKILDGVESIPPDSLSDERMQRLIAINTETLKRVQNVSKKIGALERKQKSAQVHSVPESKDPAESQKNETSLLREKLEAIRSMEKQLDESGGAK
jgi:hypothetical protein